MTMTELKFDAWVNIIEAIAETPDISITEVSKHTNCTYAHTTDIIKILTEKKLINTEKEGRINQLTATKNGKIIAENIRTIKNIIGGTQNGK